MKTVRRRRKEGKTDYKARFGLLKSEMPRLVVRKTNRYIIAQIVLSEESQDRTIAKVSSKDLLLNGWSQNKFGSLKSLIASYLTGFLLGILVENKIKEAMLDSGLHRNVKGSRIYAVLKGFLDAGIQVSHNPEALPPKERLKLDSVTSKIIQKIKEKK